jgi:hypothetical protein
VGKVPGSVALAWTTFNALPGGRNCGGSTHEGLVSRATVLEDRRTTQVRSRGRCAAS